MDCMSYENDTENKCKENVERTELFDAKVVNIKSQYARRMILERRLLRYINWRGQFAEQRAVKVVLRATAHIIHHNQ